MSDYHVPVLLQETLSHLIGDVNGLYMDMTFGGGGHSKAILDKLGPKGDLVVFDQDVEAQNELFEEERICFVKSNFRHVYRFWKWMNLEKVDGILADLGVSSHQFDVDYRGFSYRFDAPLDMRMNEDANATAAHVLNTYDARQLQDIFSRYGEIRNSRTLAKAIVDYRKNVKPIEGTFELNQLVNPLVFGDRIRYLSQLYQALRIEVNEEMDALADMLESAIRILKPGGKLVVISYHSLEDRMVKRYLKSGNREGKVIKDDFGKPQVNIKQLGKLILPTEEEQKINSRSRSAKMRVGQRI
ncbi:MAG: 16S rRNA (cytosine(1402)-N(4))-methyltransferase RsmH [Saprospiraceae bacterium]|nr:16S rRNA (cytosine(1402)-N(4))-methyltransferase RsmH [Saprospiraceae bacterium]